MMSQKKILCVELGRLLVGLQFGLLLGLALLNLPAFRSVPIPWEAAVLALAGLGLGTWSLGANQPGNFNIRPQPKEGAQLIMRGPYRWIRHPMYTSVATWGAACAWGSGSLWGALALMALVGVLLIKATLEERWMAQLHPSYAQYRTQTWRFIPWVF